MAFEFLLSRANRLTKKKDFDLLFKQGRSVNGDFLVLKYRLNGLKDFRCGFVVSKKISKKAVLRNRVKRRLRESVRAYIEKIKPGYDFVFFTKPAIISKKFDEIKNAVEEMAQRAKILETQNSNAKCVK